MDTPLRSKNSHSSFARALRTLSIALTLSLTFAACASEESSEPSAPETITAQTGDIFSQEEIHAVQLSAEQKAYRLENGSMIIVNSTEPLPDQVLAELSEKLTSFSDASAADRGNRLVDFFVEVHTRTNKHAVAVWRNLKQSSNPASGWEWLITHRDPDNRFTLVHLSQKIPNQTTAITEAESFIQQQDDPARWVLVHAENG